jgi:hypothetical protein
MQTQLRTRLRAYCVCTWFLMRSAHRSRIVFRALDGIVLMLEVSFDASFDFDAM